MNKVCHMSSVHRETDTRILQRECKSLASAGYSVTLICSGNKLDYEDEKVSIKFVKKEKKRLKRIFKTSFDIYRKGLSENAAIYHFHDPELIPVGLMFKMKRKKVIYDIHENYSETIKSKSWIPKYFRIPLSILYSLIEKYSLNKFDALISAWPKIDESLKKNNLKSVVVRNFPKLEKEKEKENDVITENIISSKRFFYAGIISRERGIIEILDALSYLVNIYPDVRLDLCGEFTSEKVKAESKSHVGWKYVDFHGWTSQKKAREIALKSVAGLIMFHDIPNHKHSEPNKLYEYMMYGLPVIATSLPNLQSVIKNEECGILVDDEKPETLNDALIEIIENPNKAYLMGQNGKYAVAKNYNWSTESQKLISTYESILTFNKNSRL